MALKGNKGEWSEVYTLFKLLGDGKVYAGDQNLNKIQGLFYPIIMILRQEKYGDYNYRLNNKDVVVQTPQGEELLRIPAEIFLQESEKLLNAINCGIGAFPIPETEHFMNTVHCYALKAKSADKTDIRIILHDHRTKLNSEMGFSIKSQLGGNSTLVNASKSTNFIFIIKNAKISSIDIARINAIDSKNKVFDRFEAIKRLGGIFVFDSVDNFTFRNNLIMLDGDLPNIIANLLMKQMETGISDLKALIEILGVENPLGFEAEDPTVFYEYKIKHFLTASALGMMPSKAWCGRYDANGGYLVVKKDGEILCYHFYDRNRFEDYLYTNAYLERSSTTRHEYASIVKDNNRLIFKLNLQIRLR